MFKRLSIVISAIAVLGMILTACGPAASTYTCTDSIGCVTIGPTDPIHIAYLLVVSGANCSPGHQTPAMAWRLPSMIPAARS